MKSWFNHYPNVTLLVMVACLLVVAVMCSWALVDGAWIPAVIYFVLGVWMMFRISRQWQRT